MKDLNDFSKDFQESLNLVQSKLGETMVKIGSDALALIKKRVQEEGIDAKGKHFPPYSTEPMLVGCKSFKKKSCDRFFGPEKNKQHEWVTLKRGEKNYRLAVLEGGYRELREMELGGKNGEVVNFTYTGKMWGDVSIISGSADHDSGTVVLGAKNQEQKEILYHNTERNLKKGGGEILDLSESEINTLKDIYLTPILNIFI